MTKPKAKHPTITAFEASPDRGQGLARDMRVRWALEEVGQPYEVRLLSFTAMKEPAHLAIHPFGQIPTYQEGDLTLFETGSIILHISERHAGLFPADANARARAITWMFAALSTVEPPTLERETATMQEGEEKWTKQRMPLVVDRIRNRLKQLSARLGNADWLDGAFSAGDLMMVHVLLRLKPSGILDAYPSLCAYVARAEARPAYKRAFADQLAVFKRLRPDTVKEQQSRPCRKARSIVADSIAVSKRYTNDAPPKPKFQLACGVALGPLFYVVVVAQILTRSGFDIRRHPISLLSLGDAGWIQIVNFIVAGLLAIACSVGMRRALRNTSGAIWGPLLIATYGLGMLVAGLFPPDPLPGFPPGALAGIPAQISQHAMLHGAGFFVAFLSLIAACFVFARHYFVIGKSGWGIYSIATGVITPLLILTGMMNQSATSISFFVVGIIAFGWVGAVAAQLTLKSPQ